MWTQQRLQLHIDNHIEESVSLEYKAAGALQLTEAKKLDISKDVASFANSNGGIIIYGMTEHNENGSRLPSAIDPIDSVLFSKESLEQIINFRIQPRIHGIIIHVIIIGPPAENKVVYVVEIPKSNTAHQSSDKKYYRRYNFQSVPMEDWEIKDIINRKNKTQVTIYLRPNFPPSHEQIWMASDHNFPMD